MTGVVFSVSLWGSGGQTARSIITLVSQKSSRVY